MKCVTTLGELISSEEFVFLESHSPKLNFLTRAAANSKRRSLSVANPTLHVCFNPALNCYSIVHDVDFKAFKRCASYVKKHYDYFERIGIL